MLRTKSEQGRGPLGLLEEYPQGPVKSAPLLENSDLWGFHFLFIYGKN